MKITTENFGVSDYSKVRTPFYRIYVGGPNAASHNDPNPGSGRERTLPLPMSLLKLVEAIEIKEALFNEHNANNDFSITIKFVNGSREPFPISGTIKPGLFELNLPTYLTNRSGLIQDLEFTSVGLKLGQNTNINKLVDGDFTQQQIEAAVQVESGLTATYPGHVEAATISTTAPKYLFQENNIVEVEWGYILGDGSLEKRSAMGYVTIVQSDFPQEGQVKTTIVCQVRPRFDMAMPSTAIALGIKDTSKEIVDVSTVKALATLFDKAGMPYVLSQTLNVDKLVEAQKYWPTDMSFDEFMKHQAKINDVYYTILINTNPNAKANKFNFAPGSDAPTLVPTLIPTGVPVLVFMSSLDFESKEPSPELSTLLKYKEPGSIIKNINFKVDFATANGSTTKVIDVASGQIQQDNSQYGSEVMKLFSKTDSTDTEEVVNTDPTSGNSIKACVNFRKTFNLQSTYRSEVHASPQKGTYTKTLTDAKAVQTANAIQLEMNCIGSVKLSPGVIRIGGIGKRYSGRYNAMVVTHTIDSHGYNTRIEASSFSLTSGGLIAPKAAKADNKGTESFNLFQQILGIPR